MKQKKILQFLLIFASACCYLLLGYFTKREQFYQLIFLFSILFIAFVSLYQLNKNSTDLNFSLSISLAFRLILLLMIPNLSNDFYRFIWDGRLINMGLNPYLFLPNELVETDLFGKLGQDATELYNGLGSLSVENYTCYPPVNQFIFSVSTFIFPHNIIGSAILLRIVIILSDVGTIWFGRKILKEVNLSESNILLYALNPFIVIELTGNLHFEATTIFFLVAAIFLLLKSRNMSSSIMLALSASVKLIPLVFIPVFLRKLGQRRFSIYSFMVVLLSFALFIPFFSPELYFNFTSSLDLYFRKFEFNAGIYYLVRWIGYQTISWNIIEKAGPILSIAVFIIVLMISAIPKNEQPKKLIISMLFAISVYYFLSTTIHPWYIAIPLIISVFTRYRFVIVWSYLIMFSYIAYQTEVVMENLWLIGMEYTIVYGYLVYELVKKRLLAQL